MKTHHIFEHDNVSEALPSILAHVMMDGEEVGTRQGERAQEILMPRIVLNKPWQREVLVPGRKASIAAQIAETMWVLAGRNDVEWLSHYLPRAAEFSDDGETWRGGYGPRLRKWDVTDAHHKDLYLDQIEYVVRLLNKERGTRRAVINIYDPALDTPGGKDVPCNNWLSFISRLGKLHMNVATRSNDVIWGWSGINQFEWSVLQEIIAVLTGNQVGTLTFNVTSLHVYEKHWRKAQDIASHAGEPLLGYQGDSPRFNPEDRTVEFLDKLISKWFRIEEQIRDGYPSIELVNAFPEPMLRSWLQIIQWYWSKPDTGPWLEGIMHTRLHIAAEMSPKRAGLKNVITARDIEDLRDDILSRPAISTRDKVAPLAWTTQFVEYVDNLHREKSAVYGDSWKRRGEQMAILANIARKVDRLGEGGAGDTAADTVIDLLVYLAKYALWLNQQADPKQSLDDENEFVRGVLQSEDRRCVKVVQHASIPPRIIALKEFFEQLTILVQAHEIGNALPARMEIVDHMITLAFPTARYFWGVENGHVLHPSESADLFRVPLDEVEARVEANKTRRWEGYEVGENLD